MGQLTLEQKIKNYKTSIEVCDSFIQSNPNKSWIGIKEKLEKRLQELLNQKIK